MADETIEAKALKMGWIPKDQFRGDLEKWRPAEEFVQRGEEMMPILKAANRDLHTKLDATTAEVQGLKTQLQKATELLTASQESIEALKEFNSKSVRDAAKGQIKDLKAGIVNARKEEDVERELELTEQLNTHQAALREAEENTPAKEKKTPAAKPTNSEVDPQFAAWCADNDWYGKDYRKTALANGIAAEMKAKNDPRLGRQFLDAVTEEVNKTLGGNPRREGDGKIDDGERSNGGGSGNNGSGQSKSYSDLPADAKAACEHQAKRLVGEGRAFKTVAEWRKAYSARYFEE